MSSETNPYLEMTKQNGEQILLLPVIEADEDFKEHLGKIGLQRTIGMTREGVTITDRGIAIFSWQVVRETPYTIALYNISLEEQAGKLDEGSYGEAFNLVINDEFETSSWAARYLPKRSEE